MPQDSLIGQTLEDIAYKESNDRFHSGQTADDLYEKCLCTKDMVFLAVFLFPTSGLRPLQLKQDSLCHDHHHL